MVNPATVSKVVDENGEGLTQQATSRMMHTSQSIL
jgi:hypothetical protein